MKRILAVAAALALGAALASCFLLPEPPAERPIESARIVGMPEFHARFGDLWMTTWADDGNVYASWGDGLGRANCYPTLDIRPPVPQVFGPSCGDFDRCTFDFLFCNVFDCETQPYVPCQLTDAGLLQLRGFPPLFAGTLEQEHAIMSLGVPSGDPWFDPTGTTVVGRDDKPSSLLFVDGRLYWAGHSPSGHPEFGYLAYSEDYGRTWTEVPGSPWQASSRFRVLMFLNMGQAYELNEDGYVYALGMGREVDWVQQTIFLTRIPRTHIADYASYEYFAGRDAAGAPVWSSVESSAIPLDGLQSEMMASAIYHEGIDMYLFLTAWPGALFAAPEPWGPWSKVADLFHHGDNPYWMEGGYIPGLISKGAGSNTVYFTFAGGVERYVLHVGLLEMELADPS